MTGSDAPAPRGTSRVALVSLLTAEGISAIGAKMSFLAIPWLVLVTTGSPLKMGLVAFAQTAPYVVSGIFGTPLVDRFGMRNVSILNDASSALLVAGIAAFGQLDFLILVTLAATMGAVQGVGDRAKRVLLQPVAELAGANMKRVVAIVTSLNRVNALVGVAIGGPIIAWLGPIGAIWLDSASYASSALLVIALVRLPKPAPPPKPEAPATKPEPYGQALRTGFSFLKRERLLSSLVGMMFLTNMFNQASAVVLVPLWVMQEFGSPLALGWVSGALAAGAIAGNVVFIGLVNRLPRYVTFIIGYLIGGSPRFLVLAFTDDLAIVLAVTFVSGIAISAINPTYGALMFERIPRPLQARVFGLTSSVTFGGIPLGGLLGAWFVAGFGLSGGLLAAGVLYFAATLSPIVGYRVWKRMDDTPVDPAQPELQPPVPLPAWVESLHDTVRRPPVSITLRYAHRRWTVHAFHGNRRLAGPIPIASADVLHRVKMLDLPEIYETVEQLHAAEIARVKRRREQLRARLAHLVQDHND